MGRGDPEFRGFGHDALFTAIWQASISAADLLQIALIARVLGLGAYGDFVVVSSFVVLVDQFIDVRVTNATTAIGARRLLRGPSEAVGVFQASYMIDAVAGVIGFLVVVASAPLVGPHLGGAGGTELTILYAVFLLGSTLDNTSTTVLRLLSRFRLIAAVGAGCEILRVTLIVLAVFAFGTLPAVLISLVVYGVIGGIVYVTCASVVFRACSQTSLIQPAWKKARGEMREVLGMVLHTNMISYSRLVQTQLPTLLLGVIAGSVQAGVYKIGMALALMIGRVSDPASGAITPRVARLLAAGRYDLSTRLVQRATAIAVPVMTCLLLLAVLLRDQLTHLLGGNASGSTGVVVILCVGAAINGALFWNIPVLFAARLQRKLSRYFLALAVLQIVFLFVFIPTLEAIGAALSFLIIQLISNGVATVMALRVMRGGRATATEAS